MNMIAEFVFGVSGLILLSLVALAGLALFLMWLTRRQIKQTAPTLGDAAIAQPPAGGRQQWARLIENTTMIF